ncbi:carboxypeptidase-like regulatory domain-containing protein [Flavicella sediminum]|uniref:carboxypeptidase-like regulatory domain-containing protein n=1 Tax=Flavicella sediminum TaxID=2585141 RepID=UPI00111CBB9E|nr:carboxypeptidase-like regulatory domain-containing protein [Flavicella sediminum]
MKSYLKKTMTFAFVCGLNFLCAQTKTIAIEGTITDETGYSIPYAAITIQNKSMGTSSTDEGTFYLAVSPANLTDTLSVSSIGFKTFKIKLQDFLKQDKKTIVIKEDVTELNDVELKKAIEYPKLAKKALKQTTVRATHQLNVLYRRASVENNVSRFFVEHYMKITDNGPSGAKLRRVELVEGRKSADYRFIKNKQWHHAIHYMADQNILRQRIAEKKYTWTKVGDSSYDGEDIIIVEGQSEKDKWLRIKLYIGMDTYGIYRFESTLNDAVYIYKKAPDGKLYLSYHKREMKHYKNISPQQQMLLKTTKKKIPLAYRHELFVLGIETDRSKIDVTDNIKEGTDLGDIAVPYRPEFWNNFSLPPDTEFFKKIKKDLKSIYGVPLETQYNLVNKK